MRPTFLALLFLINVVGFSQESQNSTTEEEYNYMTKGYRVQTESGLDMKKGYRFGEYEVIPVGNYSFEVKPLIREAQNELAGILVISKSKISGRTYYLAIPVGNSDLMGRYYAALNEWDSSILSAYSYVISAYLSEALNVAQELEKTK